MEPTRRQVPWADPEVSTAQQIYGMPKLRSRGQVHAYERALADKKLLDDDASMTCLSCGEWKKGHKPHEENGMLF